MPPKKQTVLKTKKAAKTVATVKAAKSTKAAKSSKAPKTEQAILAARESNRLRQRVFLEKHREEINEARRQRYADRKASGCCPRCGKKKQRSQKLTLCKPCLEMSRDYNQR